MARQTSRPPRCSSRASRLGLAAACLAGAPAAVALALSFGPDPRVAEAARPLHARDADYVGASTCRTCHPDRFASWSRTHHRRMTQLPTPDAVLGRFDGRAVKAYGASATPLERDGRFHAIADR